MRAKAANLSVRNGLMLLLACASLALSCSASVRAQNEESKTDVEFDKEFERTSQLIVMVTVEYSDVQEFGAGIIFGREKDRLLIVTAYHVVHRGAEHPPVRVNLKSMPDRQLNATLLKYDARADLAVLSVEKQGIDVCAIPFDRLGNTDLLNRRDAVTAVGNPNGVAWARSVEPDKISEINPKEIVFQSNFISKGHSGGALLNKDAALVGLILADQPPFGRALSIDAVLQAVGRWGYPMTLQAASEHGRTLLHQAADQDNVAAIQNLLAACGAVNARDNLGATPLHYASSTNGMLLLLKAGADVNAADDDGDTPLHGAGDTEIVRFLLKAGAKVNAQNKNGDTPLHLAERQLETMKILVSAGANVNAVNNDKETPLHKVVDRLFVSAWEKREWLETIRFLVGTGAKVDATALFNLVKESEVEVLRILVKAVSDLNATIYPPHDVRNHREGTLLQMAVRHQELEIVDMLLKAGADVNYLGPNGKTALTAALESRDVDVEVVKVLVKAGADVNAKVGNETALERASSWEERADLKKVLLEGGNAPRRATSQPSRPTSQPSRPTSQPSRVTSQPLTPNAPSSRFRSYTNNSQFRLTVPDNWREFPGDGDYVEFAPDHGRINSRGNWDLTHGVMIGTMSTQTRDLQEASEQLVITILKANPHLRQQDDYQPGSITGYNRLSTNLTGKSNTTGRMEYITVYTALLRNGNLFYMITVAPQDEYSKYQRTFETILLSVHINK